MSEPARREPAKHLKESREANYDFNEASDICDFGYVLIVRETAKNPPPPEPAG